MTEETAEIAVLDYVIFQVSSLDNSYQALICSNGIMEKLARGPLDQLAVHLPEARAEARAPHFKRSHGSFKLQLDESIQSSSWFNKFTIVKFLQIVNAPNILKLANTVENEISQLEETRSFHIALYAKDHLHNSGVGAADISCLNDVGLTQQVKVETASSDATKNELLRALDLRLTALKEELAASFNRVVGVTCCSKQISDLASFAQHFGAIELRNSLLKVLELCPNNLSFDSSTKHQTSMNASGSINNERSFSPLYAKPDVVKPATSSVSPAKVAQAERQSSSENEGSSDSSDGDSSSAERSRPVVRSATPRRSASPMRRIQIGRSGSRRSTALTIKSLNYHPVRERAISNRDAGASESQDDELEHFTKKPETNVVRMSVQDAISLFESKQKDQKADIHNRKTSEVSIGANKSVLRRWSAGMGDSFNCKTREKASDFVHQIATSNLDSEALEEKEDEVKAELSNPENAPAVVSDENVRTTPLYVTIPSEIVVLSEAVESKDRSVTAEWNRQKEAELNEMLMKMMESSKPTKYRNAKCDFDGLKDKSIDTRGGFYSHYKEKRDEKLRAENARHHVAKEAQLKVMHETLEQSKSAMASKTVGAVVKRESANLSQKPRRNSSPPVNSKKEVSKPTSTKKVYSKSSSASQTRNSLPSGPLKKMDGTLSSKSSPAVSTSITPIRRRSLPSSFPAQPSPRTEKPMEHTKVNKKASSVQADVKPNLKGQEDKKLKAVKKNGKDLKPTIPLSGEDFGALSSKSSFQNKYAKKSSVVPLESKPFLKKGSGISSGTGHSIAKAKETRISKSLDSVNNSGNLVQTEENESNPTPTGSIIKVIEDYLVQPTSVVDETLAAPLDNDINTEIANSVDGSLTRVDTDMGNSVDPLIEEIQHDEDLGISSAAWVEAEHQEYSPSCNNGQQAVVVSPIIAPVVSSSPRVRHSLSQMLQSDTSEPEIIVEWGNAENPPCLVYQKDSPKGLKRLLKFTRKSKGEGNLTGCSSPSAFSEGEEEHEESRAANKRSSDARLRKSSIQAKGYGQPKSIVSENFVGVNSSKSAMDCRGDHNILSGPDKPRDGHISTGVTATKATRSFFSLSSFRSGKSSEAKPR